MVHLYSDETYVFITIKSVLQGIGAVGLADIFGV